MAKPAALSLSDLRDLGVLEELGDIFADLSRARELLERIGFPRSRCPAFKTPQSFWLAVCQEVEKGLIAGGLQRLVDQAALLYPHNEIMARVRSGSRPEVVPETSRPASLVPGSSTLDDERQLRRRRAELKELGQDTTALDGRIRALLEERRKGIPLEVGDTLLAERFELRELLGEGGFAQVWKAYDDTLGRFVAVKVLHGHHAKDKMRCDRFFRGARSMLRLGHPGIVQVIEAQCDDKGHLFFVMEHLSGGDFRKAVLENQLSVKERIEVVLAVGKVLQYAHDEGVIHRDVKPANILLDSEGRPKITDFDLVRVADSYGGTGTDPMGTIIYAAPELLQKPQDPDRRADVYSLGMTAIFAVYGADLPLEAMRNAQSFVPEQEVRRWGPALLPAVDWKKENRWDSATDFCRELRKALQQSERPAASFIEPSRSNVTSLRQSNRSKERSKKLPFETSFKYKFRRSLVIGLGGTGRHVCTQTKRILLDNFGNDPSRFSFVRFLSIDTDARVRKVLSSSGVMVQLDRQELLGLRIPPAFDTKRLHRVMNDQVMRFLPHANEQGAMRSRPIGHAFLVTNWSLIRERVKGLIYDLSRSDLRALDRTDSRFNALDSRKLDVYVVGNLVSGTGSGMALGMGYLLRDLTGELAADANTEYRTEGVFTVCGVYALADHGGKPSPYAVNCYAALLELNHFANTYIHKDRKAVYDPGFDKIRIDSEARIQAPYDNVQLLNPSHSAAGELSHEELEPHIAEVLALRIGSAVGMTGNAKVIDELTSRDQYDSKGNLRFCWAWGAHTFRSSSQEVLDLATALAADQVLDVLIGEHVRAAMNRKEEAWKILNKVGFGYAADKEHTSLLRRLLTPKEVVLKAPAGVNLIKTIEDLIKRTFLRPEKNEVEVIRGLPSRLDRKKTEVSMYINGLISAVVCSNRRALALSVQEIIEKELYQLANFAAGGRGSLDDAIGVIDLLVGAPDEVHGGLLLRGRDSYTAAIQTTLTESRRGQQQAETNEQAIKSIAAMGRRFDYQALVGAWAGFIGGLITAKAWEARQLALREARKILDGDASDENDDLLPGLLRHLEGLRIQFHASRQQIKRLDMRFEAKIERLELLLRQLGREQDRLVEEAHDLKNRALGEAYLRTYAGKVLQLIGAPHSVQSRYDDYEQMDKDYAAIDYLMRERIRDVGANRLAKSIENNPDFDGRLPILLERSEPAIRLNPNTDDPPEIVYFSVPPEVPRFIDEVKRGRWLTERVIKSKNDDELFQERLEDAEPRVDILVGRLSFSPASVVGIDRWAALYNRATISAEARRSVHTLPDSKGGENLFFDDLGQTGTRVTLAYLVARCQLWLRQENGQAVYEYPRDDNSLLADSQKKSFRTELNDLNFIKEFKSPLEAGAGDSTLSNPVFVHALRRFRATMLDWSDPEERDAAFSRLLIGVAQVARRIGELAQDPHLPSPDREDDFRAFELALRHMLTPLGLSQELFKQVRTLPQVPRLGEIGEIRDERAPNSPAMARPPGTTYSEILVPKPSYKLGSVRCPNGHRIEDGAKYCNVCGQKAIREAADQAGSRFCTDCKVLLSTKSRYCPRCGKEVVGLLSGEQPLSSISTAPAQSYAKTDIAAVEPERREQILSLPTLLMSADRIGQLSRLLMDFNFMEVKISRLGICELVKDYDALFDVTGQNLPPDGSNPFLLYRGCLEWIRDTLKESEDVLLVDPSQLSGQLLQHRPPGEVLGVEQVLEQARQRMASVD